jgi:ABC-type Fe3+-siderophore transport system permease subunit
MIKYIILAILVILVLSFFGYDLQTIIEAPITQRNIHYTTEGVSFVWHEYLSQPVMYFWNNIFIGILWQAFVHNLARIDAGAPTELEGAVNRFKNIGNEGYVPIDQQ